jgi:hypothetical protein
MMQSGLRAGPRWPRSARVPRAAPPRRRTPQAHARDTEQAAAPASPEQQPPVRRGVSAGPLTVGLVTALTEALRVLGVG